MANIQDLLGESYVEGMSAEDIVKALEGVSLPKDNSDEVARIKKAYDKAASEAADYKKQLKAKMSEEEKKSADEAERIQKIEQENADLKKQVALSSLTSKFVASGLDKETAVKCAEASYTGNIDVVIESFNAKIASVKEAAKAELISETPVMQGGDAVQQVKDFTSDIESSIALGDYANAAALMRQQLTQNTNN